MKKLYLCSKIERIEQLKKGVCMIVRYGPPCKLDSAPYHTICKVSNNSDTVEIFLQISHDEDNPNWIPFAEFAQPVSDEHIHAALKKSLLSRSE